MTTPILEAPPGTEEHTVAGDTLLAKIEELVHQGNVRRIIIKNDKGELLLEIPLTGGVVGALFLPVWAAIGAVAALAVDYTLEVEREQDETAPDAAFGA